MKPPTGLIPKQIHDEQRVKDIRDAIERYLNAGLKVDPQWIEEYNQLIMPEEATDEIEPLIVEIDKQHLVDLYNFAYEQALITGKVDELKEIDLRIN